MVFADLDRISATARFLNEWSATHYQPESLDKNTYGIFAGLVAMPAAFFTRSESGETVVT
jgi:hypothetical protein